MMANPNLQSENPVHRKNPNARLDLCPGEENVIPTDEEISASAKLHELFTVNFVYDAFFRISV
jgi:hypothetical protein